MTRSEREAAVARANARRGVIEDARRAFDSLPPLRQDVLRASYERAEDEATDVINMNREVAATTGP